MKIAAVVMAAAVALLGGLCLWKGGATPLVDGLRAGGRGAMQLVPLLIIVCLLAGFAEVLLPRDVIAGINEMQRMSWKLLSAKWPRILARTPTNSSPWRTRWRPTC
jgi:hypothetical protein